MQNCKFSDPQLANVRAILHRLQSLSGTVEAVTDAGGMSNGNFYAGPNHSALRFERKAVAADAFVRPDFDATVADGGAAPQKFTLGRQTDKVPSPVFAAAIAAASIGACMLAVWFLVEEPLSNELERHEASSIATIAVDGWSADGSQIKQEGRLELSALLPLTLPQTLSPSLQTLSLATQEELSPSFSASHRIEDALSASAMDLSVGRVSSARTRLLDLSNLNSADVSWTLARTFDPNVLREIPQPDATANLEEAARWYRRWHGQANAGGRLIDEATLERTIQSMR